MAACIRAVAACHSTHMPAIAPYRLQVSTGPPAPVPAPPAAAPAAVLPVPGPLGLPLGVPPALPSCLSQLAEELSPADALGSGRLPPLIEQAQRLAEKRVSAQGGANCGLLAGLAHPCSCMFGSKSGALPAAAGSACSDSAARLAPGAQPAPASPLPFLCSAGAAAACPGGAGALSAAAPEDANRNRSWCVRAPSDSF